jgi:hypothetical protein
VISQQISSTIWNNINIFICKNENINNKIIVRYSPKTGIEEHNTEASSEEIYSKDIQ